MSGGTGSSGSAKAPDSESEWPPEAGFARREAGYGEATVEPNESVAGS
jgi:hypothetical protein